MAHGDEPESARRVRQETTLQPVSQTFPPQMKTKTCPLCRNTKAVYLFGFSSSTKDGYSRVCAACRREHRRESL